MLNLRTSAAPARVSAAAAERPVAETSQGKLRSRLVGETANGRDVTGKFVPLNFNNRNGKVFVAHLLVLRWYDDAEKLIDKPEWWRPLPDGPDEHKVKKGSRRARL